MADKPQMVVRSSRGWIWTGTLPCFLTLLTLWQGSVAMKNYLNERYLGL